ncbi:serine threonine protein kinase CMGC group [Podospora pseudopauciseta]|uniref:Serine threonine protein kinase CMGC group n=2 Tax=Podospora TaxID=5144 RepID=A0ABR0H014_9PEZI|nr:serine threonine protein kinase CMGC group [Podospora pseudopauciseta]KAK4668002.1 serine threonine protein kinase CMGC group [Podospora pseudoanserina]
MSTPTTATATLPPYSHSHFHYPHHHQQHKSFPQPNTSAYRSTNPVLPPASRLVYPSTSGYNTHPATHAASNGASLMPLEPSRHHPHDSADLASHRSESLYSTMPATSQSSRTQVVTNPPPSSSKKRQRDVDWNDFYKNGLPTEIIVIDDSPEPEEPATSKNLTNGHSYASGPTDASVAPPAKRRRKETDAAPYDPVHHIASHTHTPRQYGSPSKSTTSSGRTNSANHTTAATSLGSLSSNGQYDHELQQASQGQKRKRTRAQTNSEAKRREALVTDAFASYIPPRQPIKKSRDVPVQIITDPPHMQTSRVDDDEGHYIVVPDNPLTERYQMVKLLGQGTFGKVVQAKDRQRPGKLVAIKIIRSVQKYREASKIELRVLETLKANDPENRNRCIHLRDCFDYRGHICIVMDLLGQSVFDFLKSNNFVPFPNSQIQSFARQLFTSVAFLHDLNLIHTDLKPENILLCHNEYQTFTYNRKIPSSSSNVARQATQRRVLLDTEIRLIDFGSATFQDEYHSSVVSTRHYRAPEIILGLGWSFPCDIWSIGCILVEFFTGDALFQTHDNLEHLAMMQAVVDANIDTHLVQSVNRQPRNGTNPASRYFKRNKLDYPTADTTRQSKRFVRAMKTLPEIIPPNNKFLKEFLALLQKIFVYDPAKRITAKEALSHPWFQEHAYPDDGTEAARIRAEKQRLNELSAIAP